MATANKVLTIYELLENALICLERHDLRAVGRVCKTWRQLMLRFNTINALRCLQPTYSSSEVLQTFEHPTTTNLSPCYVASEQGSQQSVNYSVKSVKNLNNQALSQSSREVENLHQSQSEGVVITD